MLLIGKLLIAVGTLLLVHAGYYSVQYESYVKLTETSDAPMPPIEVQFFLFVDEKQVVLELGISFLISLTGVLLTSGEMVPIRSNEAMHSRCNDKRWQRERGIFCVKLMHGIHCGVGRSLVSSRAPTFTCLITAGKRFTSG
ncbi:hypothetical protein PsorP6_013285 [Peronosclerospora sorghi]|uniref:Uncharacterized protein n=1 Tax=Peronosclerospora sorghi TaxID=230839 RepID=A0ACC0WJ24_9STRA|nr:hypothetical protein PsorP6_013285 [Peronosclerospora sorghi]